MINKTLVLFCILGISPITMLGQSPKYKVENKVDDLIAENISRSSFENKANILKLSQTTLFEVTVNTTDAALIAELIKREGYHAMVITDKLLTARIPYSLIQKLSKRKDVYYIEKAVQFSPLMDITRRAVGADSVQNGTELDSPYNGAGVLVGVIDQGFEFRHIAFKNANGTTRIKQYLDGTTDGAKPTAVIPIGGDGMRANGHGTHVMNIAAGSDVGNHLYGIAPKADLYVVPSSFSSNSVLEAVKQIHDFAAKKGQPYVINMSFGSQIGPHDGSQAKDIAIDKYIGKGGFICAAMGNERGKNLHVMYLFKKEHEKQYFLIVNPLTPKSPNAHIVLADIWAWGAKRGEHVVNIRPFYLYGGKKRFLTNNQINYSCLVKSEVNPYNGKQRYEFQTTLERFKSLGDKNLGEIGFEIEGNPGDTLHAWINPGYGAWNINDSEYVKGDSKYCVAEGAASIPRAIAVAAYAANNNFIPYGESRPVGIWRQKIGEHTSFSCIGPSLGKYPKPTISAPGLIIKSAISKFDQSVDLQTGARHYTICDIVEKNGNKYYYGQMSGTSQATPVVTGTVALWLQANPNLTYDQIITILSKTAKHDQYTTKNWTVDYGWGKIDAYEGLKLALRMAKNPLAGISHTVFNSSAPISLLKTLNVWKALFNNDESYAQIQVYGLEGNLVYQKNIQHIAKGNEYIIPISSFRAGVYIVKILTTSADYTKKLIVK